MDKGEAVEGGKELNIGRCRGGRGRSVLKRKRGIDIGNSKG